MTYISVGSGNPAFSASGVVLFNKNQTTLFEYPAGATAPAYTVPSTVTSIGTDAFDDCPYLKTVTIPNTVTSVEDSAFASCNLTNMTLPNSVVAIGNYAFSGCSLMKQFTFGSGVSSIGDFAFEDCGMTSLTISNSVTSIGKGHSLTVII